MKPEEFVGKLYRRKCNGAIYRVATSRAGLVGVSRAIEFKLDPVLPPSPSVDPDPTRRSSRVVVGVEILLADFEPLGDAPPDPTGFARRVREFAATVRDGAPAWYSPDERAALAELAEALLRYRPELRDPDDLRELLDDPLTPEPASGSVETSEPFRDGFHGSRLVSKARPGDGDTPGRAAPSPFPPPPGDLKP